MPTRAEWRDLAFRFKGPGVGPGARLLCVYLSEHMDSRRNVSVPRSAIAESLGVSDRQITKWMNDAVAVGMLGLVSKGFPGHTAVYQGLIPTAEKATPVVDVVAAGRTTLDRITGNIRPVDNPVDTLRSKGDSRSPQNRAVRVTPGTHQVVSTQVEPPGSSALLIESSEISHGLALAPTALPMATAEGTRVRATGVDQAEDTRVRTPQATPPIDKTTPIPLPDDWTPNAQHRVMMTSRALDHVEVIEAFEGTWQAYHERRRNWDTTFAAFITDWAEDGAVHWSVA